MNKRFVVDKIIEKLTLNLEVLYNAARASHFEATHESSKAENKYDTRGLEAAYLAGGQARQAADTEQTIKELRQMRLPDFGAKDPIDLGALVELELKKERSLYLVGPRGGGVEIEFEGQEIMVLTPQSPLGQLLMGKKAGEKIKMGQGTHALDYRIRSVI